MGCSHDPVELTTVGSLAFEATDVLSRTVEAAVDAVSRATQSAKFAFL